jgi:hypothetical protein
VLVRCGQRHEAFPPKPNFLYPPTAKNQRGAADKAESCKVATFR